MINHGTTILRDYRRRSFKGKVKAFFSKVAGKLMFWSAVSAFVVGGFCSAADMVQFIH